MTAALLRAVPAVVGLLKKAGPVLEKTAPTVAGAVVPTVMGALVGGKPKNKKDSALQGGTPSE